MATGKKKAKSKATAPPQLLWGYEDNEGKLVISPRFDYAGNFSEGIAPAREGTQWFFVTADQQRPLDVEADLIQTFHFGHAPFRNNAKWGILDREGQIVIPAKYDQVLAIWDNSFVVKLAGGIATISREGLEVVTNLTRVSDLNQGFAFGETKDRRVGLLKANGHWFVPPEYDRLFEFSEDRMAFEKDGRCGYLDLEGREVIAGEYEEAYDFSEGLARVRKEGKYGYVDPTGNLVIECKWDDPMQVDRERKVVPEQEMSGDNSEFHQGRAVVGTRLEGRNFRFGYIDRTGRLVHPITLARAWPFQENGFARVQIFDPSEWIDHTKDPKIPEGWIAFMPDKRIIVPEVNVPRFARLELSGEYSIVYAGEPPGVPYTSEYYIDLEGRRTTYTGADEPILKSTPVSSSPVPLLKPVRMENPAWTAFQDKIPINPKIIAGVAKREKALKKAASKSEPTVKKLADALSKFSTNEISYLSAILYTAASDSCDLTITQVRLEKEEGTKVIDDAFLDPQVTLRLPFELSSSTDEIPEAQTVKETKYDEEAWGRAEDFVFDWVIECWRKAREVSGTNQPAFLAFEGDLDFTDVTSTKKVNVQDLASICPVFTLPATKAASDSTSFVGDWESKEGVSLRLYANGLCEYAGPDVSYSANYTVTEQDIVIGRSGRSVTRFKIERRPKSAEDLTMKAKGQEFTRKRLPVR